MLIADLALAQRLERNEALSNVDYVRTMQQMRPDTDASLTPIADGYAVATGAKYPVNCAYGVGMTKPVQDTEIDALAAFFQRYHLPARVELCPLADSTLVQRLTQRGYHIQRFLNVLVCPLPAPPRQFPSSNEMAVNVAGPNDAARWAMAAAPQDAALRHFARIVFCRPDVTCLWAQRGDTIVGTAALLMRDGIGMLFFAGTATAYRQQGVQAALIAARLAMAAAAGCDIAAASTVPGNSSQRNLQRASFQVGYTKIVMQR